MPTSQINRDSFRPTEPTSRSESIQANLDLLPHADRDDFHASYQSGKLIHPTTERGRSHLDRLVSAGSIVRPYPGTYALALVWDRDSRRHQTYQLVRTIADMHPDWTFWGPTAAVIHGLAISNRYLNVLHVSQGPCHRQNCTHLCWHTDARLETSLVSTTEVTSLAQTAFDCMRYLNFPHALAIADSALRIQGAGPDWLRGAILSLRPRRVNARHALQVAQFADARAESGGESIARATMIQLGFEVPDLQVELVNGVSGGMNRVDFLWKLPNGQTVIGELDGRTKYYGEEVSAPGRRRATDHTIDQLADERLRESQLTLEGRVMRFSAQQAANPAELEKLLYAYGVARPRGYQDFDFRKVIAPWTGDAPKQR